METVKVVFDVLTCCLAVRYCFSSSRALNRKPTRNWHSSSASRRYEWTNHRTNRRLRTPLPVPRTYRFSLSHGQRTRPAFTISPPSLFRFSFKRNTDRNRSHFQVSWLCNNDGPVAHNLLFKMLKFIDNFMWFLNDYLLIIINCYKVILKDRVSTNTLDKHWENYVDYY